MKKYILILLTILTSFALPAFSQDDDVYELKGEINPSGAMIITIYDAHGNIIPLDSELGMELLVEAMYDDEE